MKRILLPLLLAGAFTACTRNDESAALLKSFQNPPKDARPYVWWHWMNGNITADGVRKDLLWMDRAGIGGFHHFDAALATPQIVPKRLIYMQEDWKEVFRGAIALGDSLGLEMSVASSPGWSCTGGPWVTPADAMKKLVWRESMVRGGQTIKEKLPDPFAKSGTFQNAGGASGAAIVESGGSAVPDYYEDIAVLAVRLPAEERSLRELGARLTASSPRPVPERLCDGDYSTGEFLQGNGRETFLQYSFPEPVEMASVSVADHSGRGATILEFSQDGKTFEKITDIPAASASQVSLTFPPVKARYFRLRVGPNTGNPLMALLGYGTGADEGSYITEFNLYGVPRIDNFEEKAGFTTSSAPLPFLGEGASWKGQFPASDQVLDISACMDKDGLLQWEAPEGRWRILRLGWSLTGKQNHPAPPEATGLEVDKLDPAAWERYFTKYLDMYREASGGLLGEKGIRYILTDSYEAGCENWTPALAQEFKARRGYDLLPWMPVLTGQVIDSVEESEGFLRDYRTTLAELVEENYDRINTLVAAYKMKGRYSESHESGRVLVADGMNLKRSAAVPMAAIWVQGRFPSASTYIGAEADMRESASVAHIYGGNLAAAESMTTVGYMEQAYTYCPENLKPVADREFAAGINRIIVHESAHQPVDDKVPGLGLSVTGQWFNRHECWAEQARPWTDYLARTSYLLRQGVNVADILILYGEDSNITALYGATLPDIPAGYNYDYANKDALLAMRAEDGEMVSPGGTRYKVLLVDRGTERMSTELLQKIAELSAAGVPVCGQAPKGPYSLSDNQADFSSLVGSIWNDSPVRPLQQALAALPADVRMREGMRFVHRSLSPTTQIYWISKPGPGTETVEVSLRCEGLRPSVWNPVTGQPSEVSYRMEDGRTTVFLEMVQDDALFVVLSGRTSEKEGKVPSLQVASRTPVEGLWEVSFQQGRRAPEGTIELETGSFTENSDPGIKYFSGTATYRKVIGLHPSEGAVVLDLGDVKNIAEVSLNGKPVATLWKAPFKADVTQAAQEGENLLEVKVTNLWPNRLIGDSSLPEQERITYTPTPFYSPASALLPSGLIGPVQIVYCK